MWQGFNMYTKVFADSLKPISTPKTRHVRVNKIILPFLACCTYGTDLGKVILFKLHTISNRMYNEINEVSMTRLFIER